MDSEQSQSPRNRPRVARACERCRVKKAKCDGEKPCRRCILDKTRCSYQTRRKSDTSNTNQRHTNLLIQQQQELTAGLLELYKRVVNRQGWDGAPVEEVEGIPSVHGILQRLGILDDGDEVGEMTPSNSRLNRETISQLAAAGTHPVSTIIAPNLSEAPAPAQLSPKRPAEEHQLMHAPMPTGLDLVPPGPMAGFEDPAQFGVFPQFPSPPWEYSPSEYSPWEYTLEAGWVWSALV